jgi:hypothetical protein
MYLDSKVYSIIQGLCICELEIKVVNYVPTTLKPYIRYLHEYPILYDLSITTPLLYAMVDKYKWL